MKYNIVYHTFKQNLYRKINLEKIIDDCATFSFEHEDYEFQLILLYPLDQEFLNERDLEQKITNFYNDVLKVDSDAFLFKIDLIEIARQQAQANQPYLISFKGTVTGKYLETKLTTIVDLLVILLESYFICVQSKQLKPIYFELNERVVINLLSEFQDPIKWRFFTLGNVASTYITNDVASALIENTKAFSSLSEAIKILFKPVLKVAEVAFVQTISFVFSAFI
ncbi:MAG: hypothetical protein RIQ33_1441 [Bacteroidota bacterium]|jgi:hypothetical protein